MPNKRLWSLVDGMVRNVDLGDAVHGKTLGIDGNVWLWKAARPYAAELAAAYRNPGGDTENHYNPLLRKVHNKIAAHLRKWVGELLATSSCGARAVVVVFDGTTVNLVLKEKTRDHRRQTRSEILQRARACEAGSEEAEQLFYEAFTVTQELIDICLTRFVNLSKWDDCNESANHGKAFALQAPDEADAQLARLFREEMIDLVCMEDCDLIAFGVTQVLRQVKMYERTAQLFEFDSDKASPALAGVLNLFIPPIAQKFSNEHPGCRICKCGKCFQDICRTVLRDLHILMGTDYDEGKLYGVGEKRVCDLYLRACEKNKAREGYCFCGISIDTLGCPRSLPCSVDILAAAAELNINIDRPSRWARAFGAERAIFLHAVVWDDPTKNRNKEKSTGGANQLKPICPLPNCCVINPEAEPETEREDEDVDMDSDHSTDENQNVNDPPLNEDEFEENSKVDGLLKCCVPGFISFVIRDHNGCPYVPEEVNQSNPLNDTIVEIVLSSAIFDGDKDKARKFFTWLNADEDRRIVLSRPFILGESDDAALETVVSTIREYDASCNSAERSKMGMVCAETEAADNTKEECWEPPRKIGRWEQ